MHNPNYPGQVKIEICNRLTNDWHQLADYFDISESDCAAFPHGREPQGVWEWLKTRNRLAELEAGLEFIKRADLLPLLTPGAEGAPQPLRIALNLPDVSPILFGRDDELAVLDRAWEHPQMNVAIFVAPGGVGKTALINKWLLAMQADKFRGAARVYGWTFYSQGTSEDKQASADRFIADALTWFGDPDPDAGSPAEKGRRLAELVTQSKTLLLLDGLEPLQQPPGPDEGRLRDQGLRCLLRDLAMQNAGLCVISTRLKVADVQNFVGASVAQVDLEQLAADAGAHLLRHLGVQGADKELRAAAEEFGGHALTLTLLGTYLTRVQDGDVRKRDKIPQLAIADDRQGAHARRVMESYERWLAATPTGQRELNILRMMGLFDRPADLGAIEALLAEPVIAGLTEGLVALQKEGLSESLTWKLAVNNLQELRLLTGKSTPEPTPVPSLKGKGVPPTPVPSLEGKGVPLPFREGLGVGLDCHPLIREHFGDKLRRAQRAAFTEAHRRLYEYYKQLAKPLPDTLAEMEPLFAAVAHGCQAGKHQAALDEVYWERIRRKEEAYTVHKLGAFGADLAALSNFFETPWSRPAAGLTEDAQAVVLSWAGFGLRGVGRLREAAQPMQVGLEMRIQQKDWKEAAIISGNLSELLLTLGDVPQAVAYARQSVAFADQSGDWAQRMTKRTTLADALHQSSPPPNLPPQGGGTTPLPFREGSGVGLAEAERLFREAEAMQQERQPEYRYLYSLQGFQFCDLLLSLGQWSEVQQRAAQTLEWGIQNRQYSLLDYALDRLSLGRAAVMEYVGRDSDLASLVGRDRSLALLNQAVEGLRESGYQYYVPLALFARAAFFRMVGDFKAARTDLQEAYEIAERGEMTLWLVDYHLEMARLLQELSIKHAFGIEEELRRHVAEAGRLIAATGYHRRDGELGELQGFLISKDLV